MDAKTLKNLKKALADLEQERRTIDEAISTLESLLRVAKKTGAKKTVLARAGKVAEPARRKPKWSPAMRKAAKERMKRYWEQKRQGD